MVFVESKKSAPPKKNSSEIQKEMANFLGHGFPWDILGNPTGCSLQTQVPSIPKFRDHPRPPLEDPEEVFAPETSRSLQSSKVGGLNSTENHQVWWFRNPIPNHRLDGAKTL